MRYAETAGIALRSLVSSPARSILTSLGVSVGVAAIVGLVGLSTGIGNYVEQQFDNILDSSSYDISRHNPGFHDYESMIQSRSWPATTADDARDLQELMETDQAVAWSGSSSGSVSYGGESAEDVMIQGLSPSMEELSSIELDEGRFFTESEDDARSRVCILGADVAEALGMTTDDLGTRISVSGHRFAVIGISTASGSMFGHSLDEYVAIPYSTFQNYFSRPDMDVQITVLPLESSTLEESQKEARTILRRLRGLSVNDEDNFYFVTQEGALSSMSEVLAVASMVTIGIAAISLLVGGIGIMNIALVNVAERTREIGTRRAIGATRAHIVGQFISESLAVSMLGGICGLLLGAGTIVAANRLTPLPATVSGWSVAVAVGFSSLVGLVFGVFPAVKASRLNPVEALHYE